MYEEAAPPRALAGVARCVWRSASASPKRIVPDGCLDLVVGGGAAFVAGPDTTAWSSVTSPGAVLRGVRFTPGRAAAVLGVAADELRDSRVPLGELWGREGEVLAERLLEGEVSPAEAVVSRLAEVATPDLAVAELVARLEAGVARVGDAVAALGWAGAGSGGRAGAALGQAGAAWGGRTDAALGQASAAWGGGADAGLASAAWGGQAAAAPGQVGPVRGSRANAALGQAGAAWGSRADAARGQASAAWGSQADAAPGQAGARSGSQAAASGQPGEDAEAAADLVQRDADPPRGAGLGRAGISERRLRRRFVQAVGYGPATYLRVSRFQRAVALAPHAPGLAALAVAAGYADQAHLSRDCRALTGLTPRAYFRPPSTVDATTRHRLHSA